MRMPSKTIGLIITLIVITAGITIWILQLLQPRFGDAVDTAVPLVEPVIRDISAEFGWQNTGILVESGDAIQIQFMAGEIQDGDVIIRGPAGTGYMCGDSSCCEPLPESPRGALIGRVRDNIFLIGDEATMEIQESGELQLRINDCDEGLFDNSGSLTVKISP